MLSLWKHSYRFSATREKANGALHGCYAAADSAICAMAVASALR
jgi:hypothetical protein